MAHSAIVVVLTISELNLLHREGLRPFFFYDILFIVFSVLMERDKLKLIVKNLELLVDALKSEVYSDVDEYKINQENFDNSASYCTSISDYDEIFEDDDEYSV